MGEFQHTSHAFHANSWELWMTELRTSAGSVEAACCSYDSSTTVDTSNVLLPEDTAAVCSAMCSASPKAMLGSAESGKRVRKEHR